MNKPSLIDLVKVFLKLGTIGFGGPAAHIAMMEDEVVNRRQWLTRSHFLDLIGATNLIPGPNSTEMAIHVGYITGGFWGLIIAGISFILPAILITAGLAWLYLQFGNLPQISPLLYGIKPAVIAVIFSALWRLGQKAIKNRNLLFIGLGVIAILLAGINEVIALLLGGLLGMLWLNIIKKDPKKIEKNAKLIIGGFSVSSAVKASATTAIVTTPSLWQLGLFFLKIGSVLFGSGYVLIAFLEGELVGKYHWLTQQQLLDAIAIGQFTPGPLSSTATFIGYVILGFPGALIATIGIFLPSFFFVIMLNPLIPKLRQSPLTAAFLDAVNVSAVALMAVVTLKLALTILMQPLWGLPIDLIALLITIISTFFVIYFKVNSAWLVAGGAIIGYLCSII